MKTFDYSANAVKAALIAHKIAKQLTSKTVEERIVVLEVIEAVRNSAFAATKARQNSEFAREWYFEALTWAKAALEKSKTVVK